MMNFLSAFVSFCEILFVKFVIFFLILVHIADGDDFAEIKDYLQNTIVLL